MVSVKWVCVWTGPWVKVKVDGGMADKEPIWERIVRQHKLKPRRLDEVALWAFGDFVFRQSCDVISGMTKIRTARFHDTVDTEELYLAILQQYREARIVP